MTKPENVVLAADLLACPFCGGQFIPEHPKMTGEWPFMSQPQLEELSEGGWRVTCYGCGVGTWNHLQYTKEQAVKVWNTRRQANGGLNWTTEKPKAPGWYWIKDPQGGCAMANVTDINGPSGPYIRAFYHGEHTFSRVYAALVGEWQFAGPIPEPNVQNEPRDE